MTSLGQAFIEFMPALAPTATARLTADATKMGQAAGKAMSDAMLKEVSDGARKLGGTSAGADTLVKSYAEVGNKAGKALGENLSESAFKTTDLRKIAPDTRIQQTFGEAGTKAGEALGKNLATQAKKTSQVNDITPPNLSRQFGEAGTKAGNAFGESLGKSAKATASIKGITPPNLTAEFNKAGTNAGAALGKALGDSVKANTNTKGVIPNLTPESKREGEQSGQALASALQQRLRQLKLPQINLDVDPKQALEQINRTELALKELSRNAHTATIRINSNTALGEIKQLRGGLTDEMGRAGDSAGKEFAGKMDSHLKRVRESIVRNLADGAKMLGPVALAGAIAGIAKVGSEYERNMNVFQAVTKATDAQMKQTAATAIQLGNDVSLPGVSAADAAEAMTELSKSGLNVADSMAAAKGALQLSRVAQLDAGKAAGIAAGAMNTFGLKATDLTGVIDGFANVANASAVDVKDVADSFSMASAVFSGFLGPSTGAKNALNDLNVAIGVLGQRGIKGSDAGTSLKQMLLQLTGPSQKAQGFIEAVSARAFDATTAMSAYSKEVNKNGTVIGADALGHTKFNAVLTGTKAARETAINQMMEMNPQLEKMGTFAYDSAGKMRPLHDQIQILGKGLEGLTEEEKANTITQIYGADATRSVIALLKGGTPAWDAMTKAVGRQGSAAELAKAQNAGMAGALDTVKGAVETAAIAIYSAVSKPITGGLFSLAESLPKIFSLVGGEAKKLLPPLSEVIKFVGNVVKAFAPIAGAPLLAAWLALRTAIQAIGIVLKPLNDFMSAHTTTSRLLAVAITAVTIAFNAQKIAVVASGVALKVYTATTAAFAATTRAIAVVTSGWTAAQWLLNAALTANPIGIVVVAVGALIAALVLAYKNSETFRNIVNAAWAAVKTAIGATADWFVKTAWPAIKTALDAMGTAFTWLWHTIIEPVWHGIQATISTVWAAIQVVWNALKVAVTAVGTAFTWLWHNIIEPVWNGIKAAISVAWAAIQVIFNAVQTVVKAVGAVFTWLWHNIVEPVWTGIKLAISVAWVAIQIYYKAIEVGLKLLGAAFTWLWKNAVIPVWDGIKTATNAAWGVLKSIFDAIGAFIKGPLAAVWNWLWKNVIVPVWNGIKAATEVWWNGTKIIFNAIGAFIKGPLASVFTWLWHSLIQPVWEGIKTAIQTSWNFIRDRILNPTISFLKGTFTAGWNALKSSITSIWGGIKTVLKTGWDWIKTNVFTPLDNFVTKTIPNAFSTAVKAVGAAWNKVQDIVKTPVRFVINTVIRDGIVKGFNSIASKVGVSPINFDGVSFATGGVMPGYTPGRDVHQFSSPTGGRLELSGGEAVMRPEWTQAVGTGFVNAMNMAARTGGTSGVRKAMGFANGGVIPTQSFSGGGVLESFSSWWEDLTGMVKSAGSAINDLVSPVKGGNWMGVLLKNTAKTLATGVKNLITHSSSGGGGGDSVKLGNVGSGQGYQWEIDVLQKAGLNPRITSTTGGGHAKGSYHYQGRAIDIGNDSMSMFNWIAQNYGSRTKELIYGPAGGNSIKDGHKYNYGSELMRQHMDHIHWAMKNGGLFKYDQGGWLNHGQAGVNLTGQPEAVLTPAESRGLKNMGTGELLSKLDELIDAVERVAPGVGGFIRGSGRGAVALGRSV